MIAVDTNVLVHAHRRGSVENQQALKWLRWLSEGVLPWGLPVFCIGEFIRIVTHPRIFMPPSTLDQAFSAVGSLIDSPTVRVLNPGARFPALFQEAVKVADARGNLAFDAQIAALCWEQGVSRLLTLDRDFVRFPKLQVMSIRQDPDV